MDPVGGSEKKIEPNKNNMDVDLDDFDTQPVDDEISPFGGKFSFLFIINFFVSSLIRFFPFLVCWFIQSFLIFSCLNGCKKMYYFYAFKLSLLLAYFLLPFYA